MQSSERLNEFLQVVENTNAGSFTDDAERKVAAAAAQSLLARLQTPREVTTRLLHTETYLIAAVKVLVRLDLFGKWDRAGGRPSTVAQLGTISGADPVLLGEYCALLLSVKSEKVRVDGISIAQSVYCDCLCQWILSS